MPQRVDAARARCLALAACLLVAAPLFAGAQDAPEMAQDAAAAVSDVVPAVASAVPAAVPGVPAVATIVPAVASGIAAAAAAGGTGSPRASVSPRVAEAIAYEHGEGVPKDPRRAAALYCEAARAGDPDAMFNLGWMYANGRGIARDYDVAASLFTRAAQAGHAQAARVLTLFRDGHHRLPECLSEPSPVLEPVPFDIVRVEPDPFADLPPWKQKIADIVTRVAPAYGIEPRLALAVITVESNFDVLARSDKDARGLMQLIPETAARFRVRNAFDPRDNVRGGLSYLRWLLAYYRGEVALAAAAYNAGEGAVDRYGGVPPYVETRDYVRRVLALFRQSRHPFDPSIADPSPVVGVKARGPQEKP
jgi:TPR repeat protein